MQWVEFDLIVVGSGRIGKNPEVDTRETHVSQGGYLGAYCLGHR